MNYGLLKGRNFVFPFFPPKRGVVPCSIPRGHWSRAFDRFLDSFPNQPSSSSVIEGGCKPVIRLLTYLYLCVVHIATGVKQKARNYIIISKLSGVHNRTDKPS